MRVRTALHLPRRRTRRASTSLSDAISRAMTPSAREELLLLERLR